MTRRLLAFFAAELVVMIGCSYSPSRHNHCTPGDGNGHLKVKPKSFGTMDITPDGFEHTPPSQAFPRSNPRPRNGECPVCGTMAQPYHEGSGSTQEAFYPWAKYSRLTICEHCNTVFRQWAEGKEPRR